MYMIYIYIYHIMYIYMIYIILCVYKYIYHVYKYIYMCVYMYLVYIICIIYVYIYSVGLFLGKISVCVCCTLAFKCSMSSAGSSGMTGTGSDSTGCSSDLHKKSQVKEMSVSVHKIEAFRSCSRFHTLCISSLLVFDIS